MTAARQPSAMTMQAAVQFVSRRRLVGEKDINSRSAAAHIAAARWEVWSLLIRQGYSAAGIAKVFGYGNRAILNAVARLRAGGQPHQIKRNAA